MLCGMYVLQTHVLFTGNVLHITCVNFTTENVYLAKAVLNTREIDLRGSPFVDHSGEGLSPPLPFLHHNFSLFISHQSYQLEGT